MPKRLVFVIGAGASVPYGLPTGDGLRKSIGSCVIPSQLVDGLDREEERVVRDRFSRFQSALIGCGKKSIDRFLQGRKEFASIGKICICREIYEAETHRNREPKDCWISWVFSKYSEKYGDSVDRRPVGFVSFNYDRIVEYSLAQMLADSTGISAKEAVDEINDKIPICHVYGRLRDARQSETDRKVNYGLGKVALDDLGNDIMVMGEERTGPFVEGVHTGASEIIQEAETIVFLGFSFDPQNCTSIGLGLANRFSSVIPNWFATGYDLLSNERSEAEFHTSSRLLFGDPKTDCVKLLRQFVSV